MCGGHRGVKPFWIYLIQIMLMGFIGSLLGAAGGSFLAISSANNLQRLFATWKVSMTISWQAVDYRHIYRFGHKSCLFALLPLLAVRKVSPFPGACVLDLKNPAL